MHNHPVNSTYLPHPPSSSIAASMPGLSQEPYYYPVNYGYYFWPYSLPYVMDPKIQPAVPSEISQLKQAVAVCSVTEVSRLLASCNFMIGDKGFTSLIQSLGKAKEWRKALEVFEFLRNDPHYSHAINTYTFTTAIAACGISGRWREAEELFYSMKEMSRTNSNCAPNTVTYSALISAYSRADTGIQVDKILMVYEDMKEAHLQPDAITFSALISACEKGGRPLDAVRILDESHQEGFFLTTPVYNSVLQALAQQGLSDKATEVFLGMQLVQVEPNLGTYHALMSAYKKDGKWESCKQLLSEMEEAGPGGVKADPEAYSQAIAAACEADQVGVALDMLQRHQQRGFMVPGALAAAVVAACNREGSGQHTEQLRKLGLLPPTSARSRGPSQGPSGRGTPVEGGSTPRVASVPRPVPLSAREIREIREWRPKNPQPSQTH